MLADVALRRGAPGRLRTLLAARRGGVLLEPPPPHEAGACGGVSLAHFFPRDAGAALARLPTLPALNCLLAGPAHRRGGGACDSRSLARSRARAAPRSGKTTLLFTYAVNAAADGGRAVFLCRRERLEASPPLLPPHRAPPDALRRVDMRCAPAAACT